MSLLNITLGFLVFFLLSFYCYDKSILSPRVMYTLVWLISLSTFCMQPLPYYALKTTTELVIILGLAGFYIGTIVGNKRRKNVNHTMYNPVTFDRNMGETAKLLSFYKLLLLFTLVASIASNLFYMKKYGLAGLLTINESNYLRQLVLEDLGTEKTFLGLINRFVTPIMLMATIYTGAYIAANGMNRLKMYLISAVLSIDWVLIHKSRFFLIYTFVVFMFSELISRLSFKRSMLPLTFIHKHRFRYLIAFGLISFGYVLMVSIGRRTGGQSEWLLFGHFYVPPWIANLSTGLSSPIALLNVHIWNGGVVSYYPGEAIIKSFLSRIPGIWLLGLTPPKIYEELQRVYIISLGGHMFNASPTYLGFFYGDAGIIGCFIYPMLVGAISQRAYCNALWHPSYFYMTLSVIMINIIVFSPFKWLLSDGRLYYVILIAYLFHVLITKRFEQYRRRKGHTCQI